MVGLMVYGIRRESETDVAVVLYRDLWRMSYLNGKTLKINELPSRSCCSFGLDMEFCPGTNR